MGVKDFVPLLRKSCPAVIRELPNRLFDLSGKTLVIDGTLITQRLHFARIPFNNRHIFGWHRLIASMKDADVRAICVFDSRGRPMAKSRELQRRLARRRLEEARTAIESARLTRLTQIVSFCQRLFLLTPQDRNSVITSTRELLTSPPCQTPSNPGTATAFLHSISNDSTTPPLSLTGTEPSTSSSSYHLPSPSSTWHLHSQQTCTAYPSMIDPGDPLLLARTGGSEHRGNPWFPDTNLISQSRPSDIIPPTMPTTLGMVERALTPDSDESNALVILGTTVVSNDIIGVLAEELYSLLRAYSVTVDGHIESIIPMTIGIDGEDPPTPPISMSRQQRTLAVAEGQLWDDLMKESPQDPVAVSNAVDTLRDKSSQLLDMLRRRRAPPQGIYDESKRILRAMGVPCLESPESVEGETYAASLLRHGYADYVASEDTDVLVYEVPLVRNILNRSGPMTTFDGAEIREALRLERDSYVDLALLCGTDFNQRIPSVGPWKALELIKRHHSIERIFEMEPRYATKVDPEVYLRDIAEARSIFSTPVPVPPITEIEQGRFDEEAVQNILNHFDVSGLSSRDWDGLRVEDLAFHEPANWGAELL